MVEFGRDTEVKSQTCCSPLPYTQPYVTTQACHFGSRELDTRGSISATWSDARAPAIRKYGRLFRIRLRTKHLIAWTATFLLGRACGKYCVRWCTLSLWDLRSPEVRFCGGNEWERKSLGENCEETWTVWNDIGGDHFCFFTQQSVASGVSTSV